MIKLLITAGLVYFIYRYFIAPPAAVAPPPKREKVDPAPEKDKDDEGEYVDFEEID
ncbi:MAG: DUF4834 family protein [Saprospiraceae bacterium]|nr:DUF4834 family protein [Saprospiraceae bacterium]